MRAPARRSPGPSHDTGPGLHLSTPGGARASPGTKTPPGPTCPEQAPRTDPAEEPWAPHPATSYVLCTDPGDRLLIVQAAGIGTWHLPGGVVEAGESPLDAVRREAREELGLVLDLVPDDLLGTEWAQARREGARDRIVFLWAGPMLSAADTDRIALQERELSAWRWADTGEAQRLLHPAVAARIRTPLQWPGRVTYQETRNGRTDPP
ncbi:NUDIX domain-containing protein [Kitasatospora griseola]|uniref:NUDIX domain-containing protein n=1 Tax=Kitasatospora griseola TaxID=2064 RepID=UPI00382C505F